MTNHPNRTAAANRRAVEAMMKAAYNHAAARARLASECAKHGMATQRTADLVDETDDAMVEARDALLARLEAA